MVYIPTLHVAARVRRERNLHIWFTGAVFVECVLSQLKTFYKTSFIIFLKITADWLLICALQLPVMPPAPTPLLFCTIFINLLKLGVLRIKLEFGLCKVEGGKKTDAEAAIDLQR